MEQKIVFQSTTFIIRYRLPKKYYIIKYLLNPSSHSKAITELFNSGKKKNNLRSTTMKNINMILHVLFYYFKLKFKNTIEIFETKQVFLAKTM